MAPGLQCSASLSYAGGCESSRGCLKEQGAGQPALPALQDQFPSPACLSARRAVSPPARWSRWLPRYLFVGMLVWLSEMCLSSCSGIQHAAACLLHSPDLGSSLESIHIACYFWNRGIYCLVLFPTEFSSQLPGAPFF